MLQEVLLCLAGHSSPLLHQSPKKGVSDNSDEHMTLLSPSERALLSTVGHLGDLHKKIKSRAASISSSHGSTICQAVASTVTSQQLHRFLTEIVEAERAILAKDAGYVGGYGIVPLSALVGDFAPWKRRLEWLWQVVCVMQPPNEPEPNTSAQDCTGSFLIAFLRRESHTGYADLKEMALELVRTAEVVWLRQLSTWILYGRLPTSGSDDFFIQPLPVKIDPAGLSLPEFSIHTDKVPDFVDSATASSILFIGRSLNQIRAHDRSSTTMTTTTRSFSADPAVKLRPAHLEYLKSIESPISLSSLSSTITSIRLSMSQNALPQLLPLPRVLEVLQVLWEFLLLGRVEFAISLISNADRRIKNQHQGRQAVQPVRKAGRLDNLTLQDSDLVTVLALTWSELAALQKEEALIDETFERGREWLRIVPRRNLLNGGQVDYSSLLLPVPTFLTLSLPPKSPLALFLTQDDLSTYSEINSFLLGIRRSCMHLASLWKNSSLRRWHPGPAGQSSQRLTLVGSRQWTERRKREDQRHLKMRQFWAIASKCQFVMSELEGYLQGEITDGHWQHFLSWLVTLGGEDDMLSAKMSRQHIVAGEGGARIRTDACLPAENIKSNSSGDSGFFRRPLLDQQAKQKDPATLAQAHQQYLRALRSSLLLDAKGFNEVLIGLLGTIEHFVALYGRVHVAQQNIDLEIDAGVVDAFADHNSDERTILEEMERSRKLLDEQLDGVVNELRNLIDASCTESHGYNLGQMPEDEQGTCLYTPWRPRNMDGLLMKLEFIGMKAEQPATDEDDEDEIYYSQ